MKKLIFTLFCALTCLVASAVPAIPTPQTVTQPNGEELTVRIKGDEFYHYMTTADGYTIVMNEQGYYTYGKLVNDEVVASKIIARDAQYRSASDNAWLQATGKNLKSASKIAAGIKARAQRDALPHLNTINYNNFHGIVILVEFTDSHFTRSDVQDFYYNMINQENYTGYTNEDGSANAYGRCTGSVRDYFHDNSNGIFEPQFDIAGPFEVPYSVNQGDQYSTSIFLSAIQQANPTVDFSQYDLDNNGVVDLVYFIYADTPSSSDSSSPNHIWPHRSRFTMNVKYDNKYIRDYACSAEYIYAKSNGIFDGIGTICHEFSHVLGLPDLYDTNENDNAVNGEAQHPGEWELMAGGNYQNNARTPVAYSLYDRYSTGFANYQIINAEGEYSLNPIGPTGDGYILKSPVNKEVFLIDNRQKTTKWDAYAPGHGMVIVRMDSTNNYVWTSNAPNGNANRLYYDMLRAGGSKSFESDSDPFPGTLGVPMVTNNTFANLKTYNGTSNQFIIYDICEDGDVVKFKVATKDKEFPHIVEDFEPMPATTNANLTNVQGSIATWTFVKCNAVATTSSGGAGNITIAMKKPSTITMTSDVENISMVSFDIYNPTSTDSKFRLNQSVNQGQSWKALKNIDGTELIIIPAGGRATAYFPVETELPSRYRIAYSTGAASDYIYLDDIRFYTKTQSESIPGDVNGDGQVTAADVTMLYNIILSDDWTGAVNADQNGDGVITSSDVTAIYSILLGGN